MSKVTLFNNFWQVKNPNYVDIDYVFDGIRSGKIADKIKEIRGSKTKEERDSLKKKLPCVLFSGEFTERADSAITKHSGIMCLDFDKFSDDLSLMNFKQSLQDDGYIYAVFDSPSGNGIKVLVKVTDNIKSHRGHFKALKEYFNHPNWDDSCVNESRICYMSYDPNIYVNPKSQVFTSVAEKSEIPHKQIEVSIQDDDMIIKNLYKWWEERYGLVQNRRNINVFILAMAFNEFGVSEINALNFLSQFEMEDFTGREIKSCVESAYKKTHLHGSKQFTETVMDTYKAYEPVNIITDSNINMSDIFTSSFVDVKKPISKQPIAISIGKHEYKGRDYDTSFGTFGNFSCIVGASKSKKSFFKSMLVASFLGGTSKRYCGNILGHRDRDMFVLDIDTEQSEFDAQRVFKRVMEMTGVEDNEYYKPFALRPYDPLERLQFIEWLVYESDYKDNIGFLSIDGIADLTHDFNDLKASSKVIQKLMTWTDDKKFHLTTVIHSNYGTGKPTGHLGTSILKKAETICMVDKKEENVSIISFPYTRSMGINDISFSVIDGIPTIINALDNVKIDTAPVRSFYEKPDEDPPF